MTPRYVRLIIDSIHYIIIQVPDTVERSKRFDVSKSLRFRMQSRGRNLPSVLPGEETFVCQSQKAALSSTAAEDQIEVSLSCWVEIIPC